MTEQGYLNFVDHSIQQMEQQLNELHRQRDELSDYVAGRRKSRHKLGSIYFQKFGQWMSDMITTAERWE